MSNKANMIPIPGRLHSVAEGEPVCGSDEVLYEPEGQTAVPQSELNKRVADKLPASVTNPFNGLGRVVLPMNLVDVEENGTTVQKNVLTQSMINQANTIYVIQYDYVLGEDITVPANCVLEFEGGSISASGSNDTVTGTNTKISGDAIHIFSGVHIDGNWIVPNISSNMFINATSDNVIKELVHLSNDNIFNIITIEEGTYTLDIEGAAFQAGLWLKSNTKLVVMGHIKLNATESGYGSVVQTYTKNNIEICGGGIIEGEASSHTTKEGEWCHGIFIGSSTNVYIHDVEVKNNWGDGIGIDCIVSNLGSSEYVKVERCISHDNKRLGIAVGYSRYVSIIDCEIYNISGKNPQAGIDLEPNGENEYLEFCNIKNCYIHDCQHGIELHGLYGNHDYIQNVVVDNCKFDNIANECILMNTQTTLNVKNTYLSTNTSEYAVIHHRGNITFNNCTIKADNATRVISNSGGTINFYNCTIDAINALLYVSMYNCIVENCNITIAGQLTLYAAINNSRLIHNYINKLNINQNVTSLEVKNNIIDEVSMYMSNGSTLIFEDNVINFDDSFTRDYIFYIKITNGTFKNNVINIADKTKITRTVFLLSAGCNLKLENDIFNENGVISNWSIEQFGGANNMVINAKNTYSANSGDTNHRPILANDLFDIGFEYFDTSISPAKPIYWTGDTTKGDNGWVDANGNNPSQS